MAEELQEIRAEPGALRTDRFGCYPHSARSPSRHQDTGAPLFSATGGLMQPRESHLALLLLPAGLKEASGRLNKTLQQITAALLCITRDPHTHTHSCSPKHTHNRGFTSTPMLRPIYAFVSPVRSRVEFMPELRPCVCTVQKRDVEWRETSGGMIQLQHL